ncbi:MAG TPA: hypothetical protein VEZ72_19945 [Paenibacillus sp.]|nr:hypothetical protein [Paenibacillus sp.]
MTRYRFETCGDDDARWDDYFLLLMERYGELSLPYGFPVAFSFIGDPIVQGDALLARDEEGRTAGALGFIFREDGEETGVPRICQAEALYLREEARGGATLYRLLQAFSAYLAEWAPETETIRFWSPADRADLRKLFGHCCRHVKTNAKDFGRIDLFETSPARLAAYTSRLKGAE